MPKSRSGLLVLIAALAVLAGGGQGRAPEPAPGGASLSQHDRPVRSDPAEEAVGGSAFRLGRGWVSGASGRQLRDARRPGAAPVAQVAIPTGAAVALPLPRTSLSRDPSIDRALRDGTRSSRSTGLPPPLV